MKPLAILFLGLSPVCAQNFAPPDLYPEARALIREAETAAANIDLLDDRSNPHYWAGDLYARAGYLEDAARAYRRSPQPFPGLPYKLWRAQVVYGDLSGAEKTLLANAAPVSRAGALVNIADLLWRMGQPELARPRFEAARRIAPQIADPERRKRLLTAIDVGISLLSEDPPSRIGATPNPGRRFDLQASPVPLFPITTDGFRDLDPKQTADRSAADAAFLTELYGRMGAGDSEGLLRISDEAANPFQKALGLAAIEHIFIQASQPGPAEDYAQKIAAVDSDCTLAKAEALSAVAGAWLRKGDSAPAGIDFEAATALVRSVSDLPLGKVSVMVSIGTAQFKGGMVAGSISSFKIAMDLAQRLPLRPNTGSAQPSRTPRGSHYRPEAWTPILLGAIRAHDPGTARQVAAVWYQADPRDAYAIVTAWLNAEQPAEAIVFARAIDDNSNKIASLLNIAQRLLDSAGAPSF